MKSKTKLVGYYNYTVILTYISVASAVVGVIHTASGNNYIGIICLLICGFCDAFDGTVARTMKRSEEEIVFGKHIDSLSDLIAFGVLPASILYGFGFRGFFCYAAMIFYVLAALIRLAFFDVQETFSKSDERRKYFTGLPVTNASVVLPTALVLNLLFGIEAKYFYLAFLLATAIAFITPFKMKKLYLPALLIPVFIVVAVGILFVIFGGVYNLAI